MELHTPNQHLGANPDIIHLDLEVTGTRFVFTLKIRLDPPKTAQIRCPHRLQTFGNGSLEEGLPEASQVAAIDGRHLPRNLLKAFLVLCGTAITII
ncbi:hypothetical protein VM1G_11701 [Cytospora mali]|uniref:Uncharacterized protein n=1 Tax=Cytospora mali TaxID=578113 RepID=A0A194W2U3_CYTMA|nr:hypothetical protein VM1G_11701 [Valsa mali]